MAVERDQLHMEARRLLGVHDEDDAPDIDLAIVQARAMGYKSAHGIKQAVWFQVTGPRD